MFLFGQVSTQVFMDSNSFHSVFLLAPQAHLRGSSFPVSWVIERYGELRIEGFYGPGHIHSHFTEWNSITWPNLDVMKTGKYSHTVGSEKKRRWVWRLAEGHIYTCTINFLIKILNDTIMLLKLYVAFKIQEYYIANLLHIEI